MNPTVSYSPTHSNLPHPHPHAHTFTLIPTPPHHIHSPTRFTQSSATPLTPSHSSSPHSPQPHSSPPHTTPLTSTHPHTHRLTPPQPHPHAHTFTHSHPPTPPTSTRPHIHTLTPTYDYQIKAANHPTLPIHPHQPTPTSTHPQIHSHTPTHDSQSKTTRYHSTTPIHPPTPTPPHPHPHTHTNTCITTNTATTALTPTRKCDPAWPSGEEFGWSEPGPRFRSTLVHASFLFRHSLLVDSVWWLCPAQKRNRIFETNIAVSVLKTKRVKGLIYF